MIVLMDAVEVENNRNTFLRIVEMIAAEKEAIRVVRVVVAIVEREVQVLSIDSFAQLAEIGAHHP